MHKALELLKKIPKGKVVTYKELARAAGTSPRGVGSIMRHNKDTREYSCYKVVASNGALTGYSGPGGVEKKRKLLEEDAVEFDKMGKVLSRHFYHF
jgi:O-6-methylguanine DNA methyltransferase